VAKVLRPDSDTARFQNEGDRAFDIDVAGLVREVAQAICN